MNRRINSTDTLIDVPFNIQTLLLLQEQAELLENIAYKLGDNTVVQGFKKNADGSRDAGIVVYKNKIIPANKVNKDDDDLFEFIDAEEEKVTAKDGSDAVFYKKYYLKQKAGGAIKGTDFENITTLKSVKGPKYLATLSIDVANITTTTPVKLTSADAKVTVYNGLTADIDPITIKKIGSGSKQGIEFGVGRNYRFDIGTNYNSLISVVLDYTIEQNNDITRVYGKSWELLTTDIGMGSAGLAVTITKLY